MKNKSDNNFNLLVSNDCIFCASFKNETFCFFFNVFSNTVSFDQIENFIKTIHNIDYPQDEKEINNIIKLFSDNFVCQVSINQTTYDTFASSSFIKELKENVQLIKQELKPRIQLSNFFATIKGPIQLSLCFVFYMISFLVGFYAFGNDKINVPLFFISIIISFLSVIIYIFERIKERNLWTVILSCLSFVIAFLISWLMNVDKVSDISPFSPSSLLFSILLFLITICPVFVSSFGKFLKLEK